MRKFIFEVAPQKTFYGGATGFIPHCFGAGEDTLEACEATARRFAKTFDRSSEERGLGAIYTGWFKLEVRRPCDVCRASGIKPGCKRKACEACSGRGSTEVTEFVFNARA